MESSIQPEVLDHLRAAVPASTPSVRELRKINAIMGNTRWLHDRLVDIIRPGERVLELGAGTGELAQRWRSSWDALDLLPRPRHWPAGAKWHEQDVLQFREWASYPAIFCSLFLRQFSDAGLAQLGERIREHARVLIACEPVRGGAHQWLFSALCPALAGAQQEARGNRSNLPSGFRGEELAERMGFLSRHWRCRLHITWRGAYRFIAVRR